MQSASSNLLPLRLSPGEVVERVKHAFQPIVSMSSLRTHGFEALARVPEASGYANIIEVLDAAAIQGDLLATERALLTCAITKFADFGGATASRLFCNIDNRVFDDDRVTPGAVIEIGARFGLQPANLCLELSERQPPASVEALARLVDVFLRHNVRIALDDFGQGFSGLDTLMRVNPHYVKIDQAFILGLANSTRQQAIVSKVAGLSHSLGLLVVAEGIETESDFRMARDLGCDLGQGYLIARPSINLVDLSLNYSGSVGCDVYEGALPRQIAALIDEVEPLNLSGDVKAAVERFKNGSTSGFIPIIDDHNYVHGAIYEADLRHFIFGDFGTALLANRGIDHKLSRYVRRCPISDAGAPIDTIVDSYVNAGGSQGVVLTLDGCYAGILSNHALLRLAAEREVASARDQNPLTFLPGNNSISRHLGDVLVSHADRTLAFFDFDNFKAFNDTYGFSIGDRALLMFADLLLKFRHSHEAFVGHIGGDDFFLSLPLGEREAEALIRVLANKFREDVESLYLLDDRAKGGLWARDRFGQTRFLPLLRASAALLALPANRASLSIAAIVAALAAGKSVAKKTADGIAQVELPAVDIAPPLLNAVEAKLLATAA